MTRTILITGATGKQGGSALKRLLELSPPDTKLRALTRNTASGAAKSLAAKGVEVVKGDLLDPASLTAAFEGVDIAFLVTVPSTIEGEVAQGKNFVKAAKSANVSEIVFTSVEGAERAPFVPHFASKYEIEQDIRATGFMAITILRPVAFMDNYPLSGFGRFMIMGMFNTMLAGKSLQIISVRDIGYVAADAMAKPDSVFRGQIVPLAGDELTLQQTLEVYSKVMYRGKQMPWKAWIPWLMIAMMPHDFKMMGKFFRENGYEVDIPELRKQYPELQNFEAFLAEKVGTKTD